MNIEWHGSPTFSEDLNCVVCSLQSLLLICFNCFCCCSLFILFISLHFQTMRAKRESYLQESFARDLSRDLVVYYRLEEFSVAHRREANIWHMEWEIMSKRSSSLKSILYKHDLKPGASNRVFDTNLKTAGLLREYCQFQRRNYLIYEYLSHLIVYNRSGLVKFNFLRSLRAPLV